MILRRLAAPAALALAACTGTIGEASHVGGAGGGGPGGPTAPPPGGDPSIAVPVAELRRLTAYEYDATLRDLLGDGTRAGYQRLPEDAADPFDNDYTQQRVSQQLIETAEVLAEEAAARALSTPEGRARVVSCTPAGPDDAACFRTFVTSFGRRALRRPLEDDELAGYLALQAFGIEAGDFWVGVETALRVFLQEPAFLYRVELGIPVDGEPGMYRLSPYELATRLSYFLWGSTPSDALLDLAAAGELETPAQRRAVAEQLLLDDRARDRVDRFHALWLGYDKLPHAAEVTTAMREETGALVRKVVFEDRADYRQLFLAEETFVSDFLAEHYGIPQPGSATPVWTPYGASGRKGILSHGTVLSAFGKFGDTSPTQRGIFIRTRLLCDVVRDPPTNANVDQAPEAENGSPCKVDRYAAHASNGSCAACHSQLDPIGFGLENYDNAGRFREAEAGLPECVIEGQGRVDGVGDFSGPAELGELLAGSGRLEACVSRQVFRFAAGRKELPEDEAFIAAIAEDFVDGGRAFDRLLLDVVSSETFAYRREAL